MSRPHSANRSSLKRRLTSSLNSKLDRKLLAYTTAAGAAGASILALAQPAHAEVVYTPANQTISANQTFSLDVNNDGIEDFDIADQFFPIGVKRQGGAFPTNGSYSNGNLVIFAHASPNRILIDSSRLASALLPAQRVGPNDKWSRQQGRMESCAARSDQSVSDVGQWFNVKTRYLGLAFSIQGQIHYGWARLNVSQKGCVITAELTGYAYETIPGKPIITGKTSGPSEVSATERMPPTLGLLAKGSIGLDAWRRD
ncbi:MAG: hypothetical protein WB729_25365 [Candidatus Sulfotelmatobacter sp.]